MKKKKMHTTLNLLRQYLLVAELFQRFKKSGLVWSCYAFSTVVQNMFNFVKFSLWTDNSFYEFIVEYPRKIKSKICAYFLCML